MITDTSPKYSGEPTAKSLATGLATLGRYGDNYMVHAAEGETFVPKEILEANPELKENLFRQMTMMGIENPNRYVVGNELNSINPVTGQPEFFFKKVFSAIKKVAKKVLPVAAPIIGNIIAPGIGGILASGLATKLTGGSAADAFKSMALSYGIGAVGRGIQGGFTANAGDFLGIDPSSIDFNTANFGTGLQQGLAEPFSALGNLASSGASNPLAQGIFGPRGTGTLFSGLANTEFAKQPFGGGEGFMSKVFPSYQASPAGAGIQSLPVRRPEGVMSAAGEKSNFIRLPQDMGGELYPFTTEKFNAFKEVGAIQDSGEGYFKFAPDYKDKIAGYMASGSSSAADAVTGAAKETAKEPGFLNQLGQFLSGDKLEGIPATLAGAAGAGTVAYFAADALMPEEKKFDPSTLRTNMERKAYTDWQNIADKNSSEAESLRTVWYGKPRYSASQQKSYFGSNPLAGITAVAAGGEIMGPGTGTSDSIPAMLSDGEFVMTAKAVRNAGNGNRDVGAARMYDMMNRFESGAA